MLAQQLKADRYEVEFSKEVSYESITELCNQIDLAVDYYQYKHVVIKINSPGGELQALKKFLWHLKKWRNKVVRFETVGELTVASAAAFMLSLGDYGYRYCYPHTRLLFHYARLSDVNNMTSRKSLHINQLLSDADAELRTEISEYIVKNMEEQSYPIGSLKIDQVVFKPKKAINPAIKRRVVNKELDRLFDLDRSISSEDAKKFLLIDGIL